MEPLILSKFQVFLGKVPGKVFKLNETLAIPELDGPVTRQIYTARYPVFQNEVGTAKHNEALPCVILKEPSILRTNNLNQTFYPVLKQNILSQDINIWVTPPDLLLDRTVPLIVNNIINWLHHILFSGHNCFMNTKTNDRCEMNDFQCI